MTELLERPRASNYYVALRLEAVLEYYEKSGMTEEVIKSIKEAIDHLRWCDWDEEQRRRQSTKGS